MRSLTTIPFIAPGRIPPTGAELPLRRIGVKMSAPKTPVLPELYQERRDTEIAVAVFRTIFLLLVVFSPQFIYARGVQGDLIIAAVIVAAIYNLILFVRHVQNRYVPRPMIVIVDAFLISLAIFFAGHGGDRFFVLYFAVVIISGFWFRVGAAFAVGALASALYVAAVMLSPLPKGVARVSVSTVALQITFLLVTAGVVSVAAETQEREREELSASRYVLRQHLQQIRAAQYVDELLRPKRLPETPGLDVAFRFRPAAHGISGDYYGVIPLGQRRWGICVVDVCAKYEIALRYLPGFTWALRLAARRDESPGGLLREINRAAAEELDPDAFISMSYAVIDLDRGELVQGNAGIEPGILLPSAGAEVIDLGGHGLVLGVVPDATYEEHRFELHTGDTIVLFTDGITESTNRSNEPLGREGLVEQVRASVREPSAEAMVDRVFRYTLHYAEGSRHRDDTTILVVRVTAPDIGGPKAAQAV